MMLRPLAFVTWRQWRIHKLRMGLTIFGIALGVAVFFAVRTANMTLVGSLKLTIEKLAGKATLQITASESGFPEEILETVRSTPGVQIAEPVVEVIAHTAFGDEGNLLVVGLDTTGDQQLRGYEFDQSQTEIVACRYSSSIGQSADSNRWITSHGCAIAQLTHIVGSPCPYCAIILESQAVVMTACYRNDIG